MLAIEDWILTFRPWRVLCLKAYGIKLTTEDKIQCNLYWNATDAGIKKQMRFLIKHTFDIFNIHINNRTHNTSNIGSPIFVRKEVIILGRERIEWHIVMIGESMYCFLQVSLQYATAWIDLGHSRSIGNTVASVVGQIVVDGQQIVDV